MDKLRTGIIGVGGYGKDVLDQLGRNDSYQIIAIADQNMELAKDFALKYEAAAYDDYRSLIVQEKLDVLYLALPNFLCGECLQLSAKKGIHVFKESPLARTLPEALEWVKLMDKSGCRFQVGSQKRFAPGYLLARELLEKETLGKLYMVRGMSFKNFKGEFGWRGDPVLAGGGVLIEMAYHLIDLIVWNMGPPERLYSLNTNRGSKRHLPPYRTEDTAILSMSFADGAIGEMVSCWMAGPKRERLIFYGTEGTMEVSESMLLLYDFDGNITRREKYQIDESWLLGQQIRQFADCLFDSEVKLASTPREHLTNVAIIESAYLSARTQLPESLKVYGSLFEV